MNSIFLFQIICLCALFTLSKGFNFVPSTNGLRRSIAIRRNQLHQPHMFFKIGGQKEEAAAKQSATNIKKKTNRPNLGIKAAEKKTVRKNPKILGGPEWTGPAVQRRAQYVKQRSDKKESAGTFTPQQKAAFDEARRSIPSNARNYWVKVAAKVPGQTPESCKAMAQSVQYQKAAGEASNFWGGYVEVKEGESYVDESADVMKKLGGLFGKK